MWQACGFALQRKVTETEKPSRGAQLLGVVTFIRSIVHIHPGCTTLRSSCVRLLEELELARLLIVLDERRLVRGDPILLEEV